MPSTRAAPDPEGWRESSGWRSKARRLGPLPYSYLGPRSLSDPSAETLGPLAHWLAGCLDAAWKEAGRPDPFTAVVVSGDRGALVARVLREQPECGPALRYVVVDPDADGPEPPGALLRSVRLEDPVFLYPAASGPEDGLGDEFIDEGLDEERPRARGIGPLATFLRDIQVFDEREGLVVAIEVLSRLPYDLYEWRDGRWCEVRVAADEGDELEEIVVAAAIDPPLERLEPGIDRWRHQTGAAAWLRRVLPDAAGSVVAVVDRWAGEQGLDLAQLGQVHQPLDRRPVPVEGTPWSVVAWRLG